jgi:hypothetical protein
MVNLGRLHVKVRWLRQNNFTAAACASSTTRSNITYNCISKDIYLGDYCEGCECELWLRS